MEKTRHTSLCALAGIFCALAFVAAAGAQQLSPKLQNAIGHWQVVNSDGTPKGKVETYLVDGKSFADNFLLPAHNQSMNTNQSRVPLLTTDR